jgi:hypothetical protein
MIWSLTGWRQSPGPGLVHDRSCKGEGSCEGSSQATTTHSSVHASVMWSWQSATSQATADTGTGTHSSHSTGRVAETGDPTRLALTALEDDPAALAATGLRLRLRFRLGLTTMGVELMASILGRPRGKTRLMMERAESSSL